MRRLHATTATPDEPVTLATGEVLTYGLYPNPDWHRGKPAGQDGTVILAGRTHAAVRAYDGKVWIQSTRQGTPTDDWLHSRYAPFTPN